MPDKPRDRALPFIASLLAALALPASHTHAQGLDDAEFTVYSGQVNGDSHLDVLMVARKRFVIIAADVAITIPLRPPVPTFAILSKSNGTYYIDPDPADSLVGSSAWQEGTHDLVFGDVLGNGENEMLVNALQAGSASFLVSLSGPGGSLTILQDLSPGAVGVDLGQAGSEIALQDADGDGQVDLYIRVDGMLAYVVLANPAGMFEFPDDEQGSVLLAWNTFRFSLDDGDVASAMLQVMPRVHYKYGPALDALGPNVQNLSAAWSDIKEIRTTDTYAEYTVFETIEGVQRMHIIFFQKDGDVWKLAEF